MENEKNQQKLVTIIIVFAIEILWYWIWIKKKVMNAFLTSSVDLYYFVSSFIVAAFSFILVFNILKKLNIKFEFSNVRENVLEILTYVIGVGMIIGSFFNETEEFDAVSYWLPWHISERFEILSCLIMIGLIWQIRKIRKGEIKTDIRPLYCILSVVSAYAIYRPNIYNAFYSTYHYHAYFNSIYRVLHLEPYNEFNSGVYGFYGILIAPFVKLFGSNWISCNIVLSLLCALSLLCYFYILDNMVDSTFIKTIASFGITTGFIALNTGSYVQLFPHRTIFPGYVLAYMIWKNKNGEGKKTYEIMEIVLITLSVVWNFETGIGCVLACVGAKIVECLQQYAINTAKCRKKIIVAVAELPIAIIAAFFIVGIYNIIVSGEFMTVNAFLFPFMGSNYVSAITIELAGVLSSWVLIIFLYYLCIEEILYTTKLCGKGEINRKIVWLSACIILAVIQMTYYVNRSVYGNLFLVLPLTVIIMGMLSEYLMVDNKTCILGSGIKRAYSSILVTVLVIISLMTVGKWLHLEAERENSRDLINITEEINAIKETVKEDTLGIGVGVPEIYSFLNWDTGFYGIDMADFPVYSEENRQKVYEIINNADELFVAESSLNMLKDMSGDVLDEFLETHKIVAEYNVDTQKYLYYQLK